MKNDISSHILLMFVFCLRRIKVWVSEKCVIYHSKIFICFWFDGFLEVGNVAEMELREREERAYKRRE